MAGAARALSLSISRQRRMCIRDSVMVGLIRGEIPVLEAVTILACDQSLKMVVRGSDFVMR